MSQNHIQSPIVWHFFPLSSHLHGDSRDHREPPRPHDVVGPRADEGRVQIGVEVDDVVARHSAEAVARPHVPTLPVVAAPAESHRQSRVVSAEPLIVQRVNQ